MKLVCVGQSVVDTTYYLHEPLVENQKYRIQETTTCLGAPASNAACLCAKWGLDTTLLSRIGDDQAGRLVLATLEKAGVHTEHMQCMKEQCTAVSTIITHVETGSRTIFNCPNQDVPVTFTYPNECDVLLMDGHEYQASLEMMQRFPHAVSILDAGTARDEVVALAAKCQHLVCSQAFASQYTGIVLSLHDQSTVLETFRKLKELCPYQIVVTLGELGLLYEHQQQIHHMLARRVEAVDTTGAGDIFHGAYAYGIMRGWKLEKCLDIASRAAALSVKKRTGNASIPELADVVMQIELERLQGDKE